MKPHLTDKELIEYEFKLAPDARVNKTDAHLAVCEQCRRRLEQLKRKFAALDLLREDIEVSQELVSSVMAQADRPPLRRSIFFERPAWVAAAAAVFVIGLLLVFTSRLSDRTSLQRGLEQLGPDTTAPVAEPQGVSGQLSARSEVVSKGLSVVGGQQPKDVVATTRARGLAKPTDEKVSEQPPFAPASAIELVTLPRREKVQLTIYNSADLTLVRERRNLTLKKGWNWLQFMWANTLIDPTSLSLEPLEQADKVDIQQLVFPPRLRELGRWLIHSQVGGQVPFEIAYFTSGLSWRAFYMGTLSRDEKAMHLEGYVRVGNSSGEDYENAQTRLIVGQVHLLDQIAELAKRRHPYGSPVLPRGARGGEQGELGVRILTNGYGLAGAAYGKKLSQLAREEIRKEGLSEYFLYTIEGTQTIPDKWGKRLLSFEAKDVPVKSLYKYDEERWGRQTITFVAFANDKEHKLGDTPIPNGTVRIYTQADEQGHLSYVGGADVKYIPVGEEVELNLGLARLVTVKPTLVDFKTENYTFDRNNDVAGWDEVGTWRIEVTNARSIAAEIEITRGFGTTYWKMQPGEGEVSYEKHDATHARFKLTLEPRSKRDFEYTVTTYHGTREESMAKSNKE